MGTLKVTVVDNDICPACNVKLEAKKTVQGDVTGEHIVITRLDCDICLYGTTNIEKRGGEKNETREH